MKSSRVDVTFLLSNISNAFPGLQFDNWRLISEGYDHAVIILDEKIVFRFPRTLQYKRFLAEELSLLKALKGKTNVPIPHYTLVAENSEFGAYQIIVGKALTPRRFASLNRQQKLSICSSLADFLTALHGLNTKILPRHRGSIFWNANNFDQYERLYRNETRAKVATCIDPTTLRKIDVFYEAFARVCRSSKARTIIHGDLCDDHMLVDREGRLSGIIDFSDAAIGDPSYDFAAFWNYGQDMIKTIYDEYCYKSDKGLLERSKWHFVRCTVDRLGDSISCGNQREVSLASIILQKELRLLLDTG